MFLNALLLFLVASAAEVSIAQLCSANGKWDLDYEFDTELTVPKVLDDIDRYIFESNYNITIVDCDGDYYYAADYEIKEYVYELEDDFLWWQRFKLYDEHEKAIKECRNCTINPTLEQFRECMSVVRSKMEKVVSRWDGVIRKHLIQIKTERETCVEVETTTLSPTTTDPPNTNPPTTDLPSTDPSNTDTPNTDQPNTDAPITDPSTTDPPTTDPSNTDQPNTDPPITDTTNTDPFNTDPPSTDPPTTDPATTDLPTTLLFY